MGKGKVTVILVAIAAMFLLAYLAFEAFESSAVYYYTISEAAAMETIDQKIRIKGELIPDTVQYDPRLPLLRFVVSDGKAQLPVVYEGVMPDNLGHAEAVILEGVFNAEHEFVTDKLMLQCPSKYEGEQ